MNLMNDQTARVGKLQLEVGQGQVRTLAMALELAALHEADAERLRDILDLLAWINHRSVRRWGVPAFPR